MRPRRSFLLGFLGVRYDSDARAPMESAGHKSIRAPWLPLLLGCGLVLGVVCIGVWGELGRIDYRRIDPGLPQAEIQKRDDLAAYGWSENKRLGDEAARFWITVENRGDGEVSELRFVDFHFAGLEAAEPSNVRDSCWSKAEHPVPICLRHRRPLNQGVVEKLDIGEMVTFEASLRAGSASVGQHDPVAILEWRSGGQRKQVGVPIGPLWVENPASVWMRTLFSVLEDTLLPAVLLFLGWLFQRRSAQLEQEREEAAKRQAALQEAWTLMLPRSHEYAAKYYMPLQQSLMIFLTASEKWNERGRPIDSSEARAFLYYLMLFFKRMSIIGQEAGGFFFKNQLGEKLAGKCWDYACEGVYARLDERKVRMVIATMEPKETLETFRKKAAVFTDLRGQVQELLNQGIDWQVSILTILYEVLGLEANRPYQPWYSPNFSLDHVCNLGRISESADKLAEPRVIEEEAIAWAKAATKGGAEAVDRESVDSRKEKIYKFVAEVRKYVRENQAPPRRRSALRSHHPPVSNP